MYLLLLAGALTVIAPVRQGEANRQPSLAFDVSCAGCRAGTTAIAFGSGHTIWFARSKDGGAHFSEPVKIAEVPALALGRHRGPKIAIAGRTMVVTAMAGETAATGPHAHGLSPGLTADGNLVAWHSSDGGVTWSKAVTVNDVPGSAREGLHAIAISASGELATVWLDLRSSGTKLYGAISKDGGKSWSANQLLYQAPGGTICQCCAPSVTYHGREGLAIMFRNVMNGDRDMNLLTWNGGDTIHGPEKLGTGSWSINACPMDGGGIAEMSGRTYTAWRRDKKVYLDQPGHAEMALGEGKDVAIAAGRRGPSVIWSGAQGISFWKAEDPRPVSLCATGAFPAVAASPDGAVLAAWEDDGAIRIRTGL